MLSNDLTIKPMNEPTNLKKTEAQPAKRNGRRKINIEYIEDKNRRHITFSKRKAGIMKKAYELSTLTGTQVLLLVVSETGLVYTFTTVKLQPMVTKPEGKNLIQSCLNTADADAETGETEEQEENEPKNLSPPPPPEEEETSPTPQPLVQPTTRPIPTSSTPPVQQPNQPPYPPIPTGYNPRYMGYSDNMPPSNYSYRQSFYPPNYWPKSDPDRK
ncbi:unnamed protein product [Rhizopus stolonifer]